MRSVFENYFSMGQLLCLPMIIGGLIMIIIRSNRKNDENNFINQTAGKVILKIMVGMLIKIAKHLRNDIFADTGK